MSGTIPKDPKHCSYCIEHKTPCSSHKGPNGEYVEYTGSDMYEPSDWVREVMSTCWQAWSIQDGDKTRLWECFGFDPRHGFWMRTVDRKGPPRQTNISGRALDATWHRESWRG